MPNPGNGEFATSISVFVHLCRSKCVSVLMPWPNSVKGFVPLTGLLNQELDSRRADKRDVEARREWWGRRSRAAGDNKCVCVCVS